VEGEWCAWLAEHSHLVAASGLPDFVLRDQGHWHDFLNHGILDHHDDPSRFHVDHLTVRQKAALLRLLLTWPTMLHTDVGDRLIFDMIVAVERRYGADE
jgi:hypothetical protein